MKQIITIFRAEGPQAMRLMNLCQKVRKAELFNLRDALKIQCSQTACLTAYSEFLDGWSSGDDFTRVLGSTASERNAKEGVVYSVVVTPKMRAMHKRLAKRKQQFKEQAAFLRIISELAQGSGVCEPPIALAVFREIIGCSMTDEEIIEGSNQRLHLTARPARR